MTNALVLWGEEKSPFLKGGEALLLLQDKATSLVIWGENSQACLWCTDMASALRGDRSLGKNIHEHLFSRDTLKHVLCC